MPRARITRRKRNTIRRRKTNARHPRRYKNRHKRIVGGVPETARLIIKRIYQDFTDYLSPDIEIALLNIEYENTEPLYTSINNRAPARNYSISARRGTIVSTTFKYIIFSNGILHLYAISMIVVGDGIFPIRFHKDTLDEIEIQLTHIIRDGHMDELRAIYIPDTGVGVEINNEINENDLDETRNIILSNYEKISNMKPDIRPIENVVGILQNTLCVQKIKEIVQDTQNKINVIYDNIYNEFYTAPLR